MASITRTVEESAGDASEAKAGAVSLTEVSTLVAASGAIERWAARFLNIEIPAKATIESATLKLWNPVLGETAAAFNVDCFEEDNCSIFKAESKNLSARASYKEEVVWEATWKKLGQYESSPNLKAQVQKVVNRAGWKSGNAIGLMLFAKTSCKATIENWDKEKATTHAPVLEITYASGGVTAQCKTTLTLVGKAAPVSQNLAAGKTAVTLRGKANPTQANVAKGEAKVILADRVSATDRMAGQAKGKVIVAGSTGSAQSNVAKGKSGLIFADSVLVAQGSEVQGRSKVTLADSVTGQFRVSCGATAHFSFGANAMVTVTTKAQALTKLTFSDAATANAAIQARASAKFVIAANATPQQVQQAVGRSKLVFAGSAHGFISGVKKKVALFIYEDDESGFSF